MPTDWPFASTVDGTAGAGRICQALIGLGVSISALTQVIVDADTAPADLDVLDLARRFETVVLGSHLVNLPDATARVAFLRTARRHALDSAMVLVEHHPLDWASTAEATTPTPGADVGMTDVRRHPPFVSAVSTFDFGGQYVRQPFTARVLSDEELAEDLAAAGLQVVRRRTPTWLEATPRDG
jgi:hypothetical protein